MPSWSVALTSLFLGVLALAAGMTFTESYGSSKGFARGTSGPPSDCCDISTVLKPRLSEEASIYLPSQDDTFTSLEVRASSPRVQPTFTAIVEPATEQDVQCIASVQYANECNASFLAVGGGHGWPSTINNANGGIQINMQKMQHISLSDDGTIARIGGGVKQRHLVQSLYKLGKQAVTGLCECTSIVGPLLGGGHSALQGFHGFASDNLVSARVILADGTAVTASASDNPDLFWALRGAGHNFGIVTSFEVKAYDVPPTKWTVVTLIYTQDKLEDFIDAVNEIDNQGDHAPELVLAGAITRIPNFDMNHPVIVYQLAYLGTKEEVDPYVQRFQQAAPTAVTYAEEVEYKDYYTATNSGVDQSPCRTNLNILGYAVSLTSYNKRAMREAFGYFSDLTADSRYNTSAWLLENYGGRGVKAQDYSGSAVPAAERDLPILTAPMFWWAGDSAEARDKADKYGRLIRTTLAAGASDRYDQAHVYVNYATGDESVGQTYGGEERLDKLRVLKRKYDPHNRFRFYMPLV